MSITATYQAMPANCELLLRSQYDPIFGSQLQFLRQYAEPEDLKNLEKVKAKGIHIPESVFAFARAVQRTLEKYPGLQNRWVDISKTWDVLAQMVSDGKLDKNGLIYRVFWGGDIIHPQVKASQGSLLRYLSPQETRRAVLLMVEVDTTMLREKYNFYIRSMSKPDIYEYEFLEYHFMQLKKFYNLAAQHDEGVICILD